MPNEEFSERVKNYPNLRFSKSHNPLDPSYFTIILFPIYERMKIQMNPKDETAPASLPYYPLSVAILRTTVLAPYSVVTLARSTTSDTTTHMASLPLNCRVTHLLHPPPSHRRSHIQVPHTTLTSSPLTSVLSTTNVLFS